ncbi:hypothetical protein [Aquimixticola soesokkakensis]|nr:hypothetical protein [Aquimixticola soesokkakensis]
MLGITAQYYHGKGLRDEWRPAGLAYHRKDIGHVDWLESMAKSRRVFTVSSLIFVDKTVCDALMTFDLGDGRLSRMPIYQSDRKTEVDCDFYLLEFCNPRHTVDRDRTDRCRPLYKARPEAGYKLPSNLRGRDVVVHRSAQQGPDLWFDPMIRHYQFLSDGVARVLIALGLEEKFNLNQCKFLY